MKRRGFYLLLSLILLLSAANVFAGPGQQRGSGTELTIALWHYTTQPEFANTLEAYQRLNPNVSFDIIDTLTANYPEVITTQLAGGRAIDILYVINVPLHAQLIQSRQLRDLTDRVGRLGSAAGMRSALDMVRADDGNYYAIPWRQDFWPLYYNRDIFDRAGVPYPENLTWDQYRDLAIRLSQGTGANRVYGSHLHTWNSITQSMSSAQLR